MYSNESDIHNGVHSTADHATGENPVAASVLCWNLKQIQLVYKGSSEKVNNFSLPLPKILFIYFCNLLYFSLLALYGQMKNAENEITWRIIC